MKRKCKNVDIANIEFIEIAVKDCLKNKKKTRSDIVNIFNEYGNVHGIAVQLQKEILDRKLELKPIWYKEKWDETSAKWRNIGIQDIKQQMYDYVAVNAMGDLLKRVGKYQCASIKGRGQIYCVKALYRKIQDKRIRYACSFDVKKYYESINRNKLMEWLAKHIKNDELLWLIETLINTFNKGLSIGSFLSQHLANLYLSDMYHAITESMYRIRNKKNGKSLRVNLVNACYMYMDDIHIVGTNSKDLIKAALRIVSMAKDIGLTIKSNWRCYRIDDEFIDLCGYRVYRDHIEVRRTTLKRIRRAYIRYEKKPNNKQLARRVISHYGILKHSDSYIFCHKYNVYKLLKIARKVVSNDSKSRRTTARSRYKNRYPRNSMGVLVS
nr:MAG TPA: hypothetical protein [Bacteriophage sp.]